MRQWYSHRVKPITLVAVLVMVLGAGATLYYHYPPFRLGWLVVRGKSPHCPLPNAVQAAEHLARNIAAKDRILAGSRKLETDPQGYVLWDTPRGQWWIAEGNDWGLPWNLAEQELKIYGTGGRFVQPGDIVLDCGAHIGVFAREALEAGARLVVAIEPSPENVECLRRNMREPIAAGRLIVYPKGVWDKDDVLTLELTPRNAAAASFVIHQEGAKTGPQVPLTQIDTLVGELNLPRVDFIKMDIEGAEQKALVGARGTLAKFHPRMALSTYHRPDDPERIPQLVREAWSGYRMECGHCAEANGAIRPDVLFFY